MSREITCPGCGQSIRVPPSHEGKPVKCPKCRQRFQVPGSGKAGERWYLKQSDGSELGPVSRNTLDRWSQEGRIDRECLIREKASGQWRGASTIYEHLPADLEQADVAGLPALEDFALEILTDSGGSQMGRDPGPAEVNLDANRAVSREDPTVSPRIARILAEISPLTFFLAFAGFVTTGAVAAMLVIRTAHGVRTEDRAVIGWAVFDLFAVGLLVLLPTWQTFLYYRQLKGFNGSPTESRLTTVLQQERRLWKTLLTLPAIGLIYLLVRLLAMDGSPFSSS